MRDVIALVFVLGACASTPTSAPLRCRASSATETATTRQVEARRLLSEDKLLDAAEQLRLASCEERALDPLLLEDLARAQLVSMLREPMLQLRAARILQKLPSGSLLVQEEARKLSIEKSLALWSLLLQEVPEAVDMVRPLLVSPNARLRLQALEGLSRVETFSAEQLQNFLKDSSEEIRSLATRLAARDQPQLLAQMAEDPSAAVQLAVLDGLPYLETKAAAELAAGLQASAFPWVRRGALEVLLSLNIAREENIAAALAAEDPLLVLVGIRSAKPESKEALQALQRLLKAENEAAILQVGRFAKQSKALAPFLLDLLSSKENNIKVLSASILLDVQEEIPAGRLWREATRESKQVLEELCLYSDDRSSVRACVTLVQQAELVSKKIGKAAKERLRMLVRESRDASARVAALYALQRLGGLFLADMAAALADPEAKVRLTAAEEILRQRTK